MIGQQDLFGGGWTEEKLRILQGYLRSYNIALSKSPFETVYIDAFAGTGYREARERQYGIPKLFDEVMDKDSQRFLKGSAKRSLEVVPPFHRFIFVENSEAKIAELCRLPTIC